jgi:hypothetical protein
MRERAPQGHMERTVRLDGVIRRVLCRVMCAFDWNRMRACQSVLWRALESLSTRAFSFLFFVLFLLLLWVRASAFELDMHRQPRYRSAVAALWTVSKDTMICFGCCAAQVDFSWVAISFYYFFISFLFTSSYRFFSR